MFLYLTRTTPFLLCFKVKGMWDMVFWQRTQKQKVLMIFPYVLKYRIPLCLLLTMTEETNKAVFIFYHNVLLWTHKKEFQSELSLKTACLLCLGWNATALTFLTWQSMLIVSFRPCIWRSAVFFFLLTSCIVIVLLSYRYHK